MANRKLPFGYRIQGGQIQADEQESEVVRLIFDGYAQYPSYDRLTDALNGQDVPYSPGKRWNKNMVARILRDRRYLGGSTYPQILAPEAFRLAQTAKPDVLGTIDRPESKEIRILAQCGLCHQPLRRERKDSWHCPHCIGTFAKIKDENLIQSVGWHLHRLRGQPDTIVLSSTPETESESVQTAQDRFAHEMDKPEFDEDAAKAAALALASAKFNALGSQDYETMRI